MERNATSIANNIMRSCNMVYNYDQHDHLHADHSGEESDEESYDNWTQESSEEEYIDPRTDEERERDRLILEAKWAEERAREKERIDDIVQDRAERGLPYCDPEDAQYWYIYCQHHNNDLPVIIIQHNNIRPSGVPGTPDIPIPQWWEHGALHRNDLPAIINNDYEQLNDFPTIDTNWHLQDDDDLPDLEPV